MKNQYRPVCISCKDSFCPHQALFFFCIITLHTGVCVHVFTITVLYLLSLSLMPRIDIKECLMIKPSAPISPVLASIHYVHTALFEYQAPTASNTTLQTPFFVSIIGSPDSSRSTTGRWVQISWPQALGHFAPYKPTGVYDLFWMLPWLLAAVLVSLADGVVSNMISPSTFLSAVIARQTAGSEGVQSWSLSEPWQKH